MKKWTKRRATGLPDALESLGTYLELARDDHYGDEDEAIDALVVEAGAQRGDIPDAIRALLRDQSDAELTELFERIGFVYVPSPEEGYRGWLDGIARRAQSALDTLERETQVCRARSGRESGAEPVASEFAGLRNLFVGYLNDWQDHYASEDLALDAFVDEQPYSASLIPSEITALLVPSWRSEREIADLLDQAGTERGPVSDDGALRAQLHKITQLVRARLGEVGCNGEA